MPWLHLEGFIFAKSPTWCIRGSLHPISSPRSRCALRRPSSPWLLPAGDLSCAVVGAGAFELRLEGVEPDLDPLDSSPFTTLLPIHVIVSTSKLRLGRIGTHLRSVATADCQSARICWDRAYASFVRVLHPLGLWVIGWIDGFGLGFHNWLQTTLFFFGFLWMRSQLLGWGNSRWLVIMACRLLQGARVLWRIASVGFCLCTHVIVFNEGYSWLHSI
jgi:hypothetical protein